MNFDDIFKALDSNMINPKIELDEKLINPKIELDEKMINPNIQLNKPSKVSDFPEKKQEETKVQAKPENKQVQVQETKVQAKPEKKQGQVQETKVQAKPEKKQGQIQETKVQAKQTSNFIFSGMSFCLFLITIFFVSTWACESSNHQHRNHPLPVPTSKNTLK